MMDLILFPKKPIYKKFLILVGGWGDNPPVLSPLVAQLAPLLPDTTICTFPFSKTSNSDSILDIQAAELGSVISKIIKEYDPKQINIFCTSMGAYATVKNLEHVEYARKINKVIFYDPADYYVSDSGDNTWSGWQTYNPNKPVISERLSTIKNKVTCDVVHLTIRNHGKNGYASPDFMHRGIDTPGYFSRLNTQMVKGFYDKLPIQNKGQYIEVKDVPHGFIRDGNIEHNLVKISQLVSRLISIML